MWQRISGTIWLRMLLPVPPRPFVEFHGGSGWFLGPGSERGSRPWWTGSLLLSFRFVSGRPLSVPVRFELLWVSAVGPRSFSGTRSPWGGDAGPPAVPGFDAEVSVSALFTVHGVIGDSISRPGVRGGFFHPAVVMSGTGCDAVPSRVVSFQYRFLLRR